MAVFNGLFAKGYSLHFAIGCQHEPTPLWVGKNGELQAI